ATDVESDVLTYSVLSGLPAGANFNSTNGTITWRPTMAQAGQSYPIVMRVTDNGTNFLTTTKTNTVNVAPAQTPIIFLNWSNVTLGSNTPPQLQLLVQGQTGPDYTLLTSTNLIDWIPIFTNTPTTFPFVRLDRSECLAVSEAFLSGAPRALGIDTVRATVPILRYVSNYLVLIFPG
ncbi:MAG: hypothetical protein EBZ78_11355, partial [Verrucomicrobia bacterium]|nr:hypothetical protein [Verrucomicrobiota bacterium]